MEYPVLVIDEIPKGFVIYHKNRNTKDNRISNLELISKTIQAIRREKTKRIKEMRLINVFGTWLNPHQVQFLDGLEKEPETNIFFRDKRLNIQGKNPDEVANEINRQMSNNQKNMIDNHSKA